MEFLFNSVVWYECISNNIDYWSYEILRIKWWSSKYWCKTHGVDLIPSEVLKTKIKNFKTLFFSYFWFKIKGDTNLSFVSFKIPTEWSWRVLHSENPLFFVFSQNRLFYRNFLSSHFRSYELRLHRFGGFLTLSFFFFLTSVVSLRKKMEEHRKRRHHSTFRTGVLSTGGSSSLTLE